MIQRLQLQSFRSYNQLIVEIDKPFVVLSGANGGGKTNILEAVSLFTPGRAQPYGLLTGEPRTPP